MRHGCARVWCAYAIRAHRRKCRRRRPEAPAPTPSKWTAYLLCLSGYVVVASRSRLYSRREDPPAAARHAGRCRGCRGLSEYSNHLSKQCHHNTRTARQPPQRAVRGWAQSSVEPTKDQFASPCRLFLASALHLPCAPCDGASHTLGPVEKLHHGGKWHEVDCPDQAASWAQGVQWQCVSAEENWSATQRCQQEPRFNIPSRHSAPRPSPGGHRSLRGRKVPGSSRHFKPRANHALAFRRITRDRANRGTGAS